MDISPVVILRTVTEGEISKVRLSDPNLYIYEYRDRVGDPSFRLWLGQVCSLCVEQ